jgi:hypothetical protein
MFVFFSPWFADSDANLLALAAVLIIGLLIYEIFREWRKKRRVNKEAAERTRSRKSHWGYS